MGCGSSSASKGAVHETTPVTILTPSKTQLNVPQNGNIYDLQPRLSVADIASMSQRPSIAPTDFSTEQDQLQYICDTDVSLEWLYQRLTEKFKCPDEPEPQWIAERLNAIGDKGECIVFGPPGVGGKSQFYQQQLQKNINNRRNYI